MARHTPQVKLDLQYVTEERDKLAALLQDALEIIEAAGDPGNRHWIEQARAALGHVNP